LWPYAVQCSKFLQFLLMLSWRFDVLTLSIFKPFIYCLINLATKFPSNLTFSKNRLSLILFYLWFSFCLNYSFPYSYCCGYLIIHSFTVLSRLLMTTSLVFVFKFCRLVFSSFLLEYVPDGSTAVDFSHWLSWADAGLFRVHCRLSAGSWDAYIVRPAFRCGWWFRIFQLLRRVGAILWTGAQLLGHVSR